MRPSSLPIALLVLVAPALAAEEGGVAPSSEGSGDVIEMHVGISDVAYIGQPLAELRARFPELVMTPFAQDARVRIVKIAEAGISCFAAGASEEEMKVISVGFNFEGTYEGVGESGYRTAEGIGKGSTVNDLLGTYGRAEISGAGPRHSLGRLQARTSPDPNEPKKYLYANDDETVKTFFQSEGALVARVVINDIRSIEHYILRRGPAP